MYSLNNVLTLSFTPTAILLAAAVMAITFFAGFRRGARRISWKNLVCMLAVFLYQPVSSLLKGKVDYVAEASIVLCAAIMWIIYVLAAALSKRDLKWKRLKNFKRRTDGETLEYEADYSEYDSMLAKDYVTIKRGAKPGLIGRMVGGVGFILSILLSIAALAVIALYVIKFTPLYENLQGFYQISILNITVFELIQTGMIFVMIKALFLGASVVYERGFVCGIYRLYEKCSALVALAVAALIAFTCAEDVELLGKGLTYLIGVFEKSVGAYADLLARIVATVILFVPVLLLIALFNYIFGWIIRFIRKHTLLRVIDGLLGALLTFTLMFFLFV